VAYCYRRCTFRGLCVCVCVWHAEEPCRKGWTDQDAVLTADSYGPKNHVLDGLHLDATWLLRLNDPCAAAMWPYVKLLWSIVNFITYFIFMFRCCDFQVNSDLPAFLARKASLAYLRDLARKERKDSLELTVCQVKTLTYF